MTRETPPPVRTSEPRGVVALCLVVAGAAALGVWVLWRLFVDTWAGQVVEKAARDGAHFGQWRLWQVASRVLDVVSVGTVVAAILAAVLVAVLRRRWSLAVQVVVLMVGANLTTQALKHGILDRPDLGVGQNYGAALPSGHTTVAASASAAFLLVSPPRARPVVAVLGAAYTAATGISTLIGQWHRPSEVLAGVLVVLAWTALTCALVALTAPRAGTTTGAIAIPNGSRAPLSLGPGGRGVLLGLLAVGVGTGAFALVMVAHTWSQRGDLSARAQQLMAYGGGAVAAVSAACLAFAVMLVLRQLAASRLP